MSVLSSEESTLSYTQQLRLKIAEQLGNPEHIADPKAANVLLKALGDMDKQVINLKRIKVDEGAVAADKEVAKLLAEAAERRDREQGNPFRRVDAVPTVVPTTSSVELGKHEFTEDELSDEVHKTTADKFITQYRKDNGIIVE